MPIDRGPEGKDEFDLIESGAVDALFRYAHRQGLAGRVLSIEELFQPASLELVERPA